MNTENPKKTPANEPSGNLQKDPDDWVTGDEPMTAAQASYLKTLSEEAGEDFDPELSKADASKRIDELQAITGRGQPRQPSDGNAGHQPNASKSARAKQGRDQEATSE